MDGLTLDAYAESLDSMSMEARMPQDGTDTNGMHWVDEQGSLVRLLCSSNVRTCRTPGSWTATRNMVREAVGGAGCLPAARGQAALEPAVLGAH
jgi:hypothetical protein